MGKNKMENKGIAEASTETELVLTDREVYCLLDRIDEGHTPTDEEIAALKKVDSIYLRRIPESIYLLVNLKLLNLGGRDFTSLSGIGKLTNLQVLELSYANIRDLSGIENLTNLQSLYLVKTLIADLNGIENLTNLQLLYLTGTQITSLSVIENLASLQELYLSYTKITNLSGIEKLANLQKLDLFSTPISDLSGIEDLTNLQELDLSWTKITSLSGIENLTNLQSLRLSGAPIANLSGIEKLTNLQWLDLGGTKIDSHELEKLAKLKNLTHLDLRGLKLAKIPRWLLELELPFNTTSVRPFDDHDRGISLYGTKLTLQPLSLFEQDRSLIKKYYESEMEKVGEAKVIFLGHGKVGKTHTIKRIKAKGKFINPIKGETPGIQITSVKNFDGAGLNVQFWDFGGQDIMCSMHRCFLTERCCYVIVVNTRQGDVNKQARYWLNNIKSYAPNAPVILFENRWGKGHIGGGLDENRLKKEFPNIRFSSSFSALEAEKAMFNGSLVKDIRIICSELDSVKMEFPKNWAKIRERLLELKGRKKPFIEKDEYYKLCCDCGETSPDIAKWLLSWFNDLGVCFSYHQDRDTNKELESYQLLAPNWIINAMYTIINNAKGYSRNGIILHEIIKDILKKGSASMKRSLKPDANYEDRTDYILEVMRKFRLSLKLPDTEEEFIPALCENNTPEDLHPTEWTKHVTYKYVYPFLPDNVVHQMMLFWKQERKHDPSKLWLKGFRIDYCPKGTAFVIDMGNDDNILIIDVYSLNGTPTFDTFKDIQDNIRAINERLGLSPYECITVEENGIKQDLPVTPLRKMWDRGIQTYTILDKENYAEIKLRDVLVGIIYPDESEKENKSNENIRKEEIMKEIEKILGNTGGGVTHNTYIFGGVNTQGGAFAGSGSTVNNGYTDKQLTELFEIMFAHQEKITDDMLDTIAEMVEKQGEQQSEKIANALQAFAAGLKESSPEKRPVGTLQKRYKDFKESNPMLVDAAGLIRNVIFSVVIPMLIK